jgi:hypothetical protein
VKINVPLKWTYTNALRHFLQCCISQSGNPHAVLADVALLCFFLKKDFSIPVPAYLDTLISAPAPVFPGWSATNSGMKVRWVAHRITNALP